MEKRWLTKGPFVVLWSVTSFTLYQLLGIHIHLEMCQMYMKSIWNINSILILHITKDFEYALIYIYMNI